MKKTTILILFLVAAGITTIFAQDQEYELYGDIRMEGIWSYREKNETLNLSEQSTLAANFDLTAYHGLYLDKGELVANHRIILQENDELQHKLYELYFIYPFTDVVTLSVGRQVLGWGTGYSFQPTDIIHPAQSPFDEIKTGFTGISTALLFGYHSEITLAVSIDNALTAKTNDFMTKCIYAGQYTRMIEPWEFILSYTFQEGIFLRPGGGFSVEVLGFILNAEAGVELKSNIDTVTIDGNYIRFKKPDLLTPFPIIDVAIQKSISLEAGSLFLLAEYFYNSQGYTLEVSEAVYYSSNMIFQVDLQNPPSRPAFRNQHYLLAMASLEIPYLFTSENTVMMNLMDRSFLASHNVGFIYFQEFDINLKAMWTYGERGKTEFGSLPQRFTGTLGVTVHF